MTDNEFWELINKPCPHPEGTRVEMTDVMDDPDPIPVGMRGTVTGGNGAQIHVDWDNGRTLMLLISDHYKVVPHD